MNNIDYKLIIEEIKILIKLQDMYYNTSEDIILYHHHEILEILFNYIDRFERKWFISKIIVNILDCHRRKLNNERQKIRNQNF